MLELARSDLQILTPFADDWPAIGQQTGPLFLLIRTPKIYLNDTGLLSHLLGLTVARLELDTGLAGATLENFVLMELRKQCICAQQQ